MTASTQAIRQLILTHAHLSHEGRHDGITPSTPPPVIPALSVHNGLNNSDLLDPTNPIVVQVVLQPNMYEGERLDLYWNNTAVGSETISLGDTLIGLKVFKVFPRDIPVQTAHVHYHHTGLVGGDESASFEVPPFPVKITVPGNPDPDPTTPTINERLTPPLGIPREIEAENAVDVVLTIPRYENLSADDEIRLSWGGLFVTKYVTSAEADDPMLPLTLTVSAAIISANPGLGLVVTYDIHDIVRNWSLFSVRATTDVIAPGAYRAPEVRDADDYNVLDVDALAGGDVALRIEIEGNLSVGDQGVLIWTGQPVIGPLVTYSQAFSVNEPSTRLTLWVPHVQAAALVGSTATAYYDVNAKRSSRTTVSVTGKPVALTKPQLTGVTGSIYNPDTIIGEYQEVVVPAYPFMAVGQSVTLIWDGITAGNGSVYETFVRNIQSQSQIGREISFQVEKRFAVALAGGTLRVRYKVAVSGQEYPSEELSLIVTGQVNTLPRPYTQPGFPGGYVDPDLVGPTLQVLVKSGGLVLPGDLVTIHWHGRPDASVTHQSPFPQNGDLAMDILKIPFVTGNANFPVDVWYDVRRDGAAYGSSIHLNLQIGQSGQKPWPTPTVEDASGGSGNPLHPIKPGTTNAENTATVIITDDRLLSSDQLAVVWQGKSVFARIAAGQARAEIPRDFIAASVGNIADIAYVVWRDNIVIATWQGLEVQVLMIPPSALPLPSITEAEGSELLDISRLDNDGTATVSAWPFISLSQRYWLEAHGVLSNGSDTIIVIAGNAPVTSLQGVTRPIPLTELRALKNGSTLRLLMKVALGQNTEATISFPIYDVTIITDSSITRTEDFESLRRGAIAEGESVYTGAVTVTNLAGRLEISSTISLLDQALRFNTGTTFSIELRDAPSRGVGFFVNANVGALGPILFLDSQGKLIASETQYAIGANSFLMPGGKAFSRMEITSHLPGDLDSILFSDKHLRLLNFQNSPQGELATNVTLDLGVATITKLSTAGRTVVTKFSAALPIVLRAWATGLVLSFAPKESARSFIMASYEEGAGLGRMDFYDHENMLIYTSPPMTYKSGVRNFTMPDGKMMSRVDYHGAPSDLLGIYFFCFS